MYADLPFKMMKFNLMKKKKFLKKSKSDV